MLIVQNNIFSWNRYKNSYYVKYLKAYLLNLINYVW